MVLEVAGPKTATPWAVTLVDDSLLGGDDACCDAPLLSQDGHGSHTITIFIPTDCHLSRLLVIAASWRLGRHSHQRYLWFRFNNMIYATLDQSRLSTTGGWRLNSGNAAPGQVARQQFF
jgi:hypothetical protein